MHRDRLMKAVVGILVMGTAVLANADELTLPDPSQRPDSSLMLDLAASGTDPTKIQFDRLPELPGQHSVLSVGDTAWKFRLHNYLAHFDGRYWCFWSHGPVIEDQARQHLRYSTSMDGLTWSPAQVIAPPPAEGYGYIARGFWVRDGSLLALASLYEAPAFHDGDLSLVAFRWDAVKQSWAEAGLVFQNTLNNFPPKRIGTGEWMMSRRASDRSVSMLVGGLKSLQDWQVIPFSEYRLANGGAAEEPCWWTLPGGEIVGLFRDNSKSGRLLRSFSTDNGRSWSRVVRTNFPDATSRFYGMQTGRGYWVLISNPNPKQRQPLCLSISHDGLVFRHMFRLPIPATLANVDWPEDSGRGTTAYESVQYPHAIECDGAIFVAYSRKKQAIELVRVQLDDLDAAIATARREATEPQ